MKATCHPDRPHRARGLCGPCYVVAQRSGQFKGNEVGIVAALVDEIEFSLDLTWPDLERMFKRERRVLQQALSRKGRSDLIRLVHRHTYGTVTQAGIASVVNRREAHDKRDTKGRFSK